MTNSVGRAIKRARKEKMLSIGQAAAMYPADDRTIYRYEAGQHICPSVVTRFAKIYGNTEILKVYCQQCPVRRQIKKELAQSEQYYIYEKSIA